MEDDMQNRKNARHEVNSSPIEVAFAERAGQEYWPVRVENANIGANILSNLQQKIVDCVLLSGFQRSLILEDS